MAFIERQKPSYRNFLDWVAPHTPQTGKVNEAANARLQEKWFQYADNVELENLPKSTSFPTILSRSNFSYNVTSESSFGRLSSPLLGAIESRKRILRLVFSGNSSAELQASEEPSDHDILLQKIQGFASLPNGWDSYEAEAPSQIAISAALTLVNELEQINVLPELATASSDSSILMRYRQGNVWYDWEFHSDGDVAVMRKPLFDKETYHDFGMGDISAFFSSQLSDS